MEYPKEKHESFSLLGGMNTKVSSYVNDLEEFRAIVNMNFATPGALTKRPGTTLYVGASIQGRITGGIEFERLNGASYVVVTANTNAYTVNPVSGYSAFKTGLLNGALFDFVTFVDRMFACNGQDYFKFDGSNVSAVGLPAGASGWGVTAVLGAGLTGVFVASYGYLNDRGYYGPAAAGVTISLGGSFGQLGYYGLTTPLGYGISALALYRSSPGGVDLFGTTLASWGSTAVTDTGFTLGIRPESDSFHFTLAPRFLELYNNQLFMGGFSAAPSTVVWSQIGEPEGIEPDFSAEFRTNDGDRVTGLKAYAGSLVVTKERSVHRVTGDDPDNFALQEISDQYGCISNRALVAFENLLWFLDSKGIVEYNGSNIGVVSNKVEPLFSAMNVEAARDNAVALHNRQANEVWFAIPCYGATLNNCVVAYDYLSKAWAYYVGLDISTLFLGKGALTQKTPFFGGYTGSLFHFGASLMGDNGNAITCMIQTRFLAPSGQTTERMFRRYYQNLDPVIGVTQPITVNFRSNYGTTVVATRTMYQAPFQSRVDFGISARSIQAEVIHASATLPFKINGFAFESRFQRPT